MKKLIKRIIITLAILLIFSLCGCSLRYEYVNFAVDCFDLGYSPKSNKAFFAKYNWDGTENGMNITLPESYNGTEITRLGGYTGRGYPSPFQITATDEAKEKLHSDAIQWSYISHTAFIENHNIQYLAFKLHISKNIQEIEKMSMGGIVLAEYEENGEKRYNVYVLTCYVTCDENNKTFYAKDGRLYFKKNHKLVEDIMYEDFNMDEHNAKNKDKPSVQSVF